MFSQGKVGLRNEFAQAFQISHGISQGKDGLQIFRKVDFGVAKFSQGESGVAKFLQALQNTLFFLL